MGLASFNRMRREQAAKAIENPVVDNGALTNVETAFREQLRIVDIKHFLDRENVSYSKSAKRQELLELYTNYKGEDHDPS